MSEDPPDVLTSPEPRVITVSAESARDNSQLGALIDRVRAEADVFVFLAGGASKMQDHDKAHLLELFDALRLISEKGIRLAVGDGGTHAGIMAASGAARQASGNAFDLIGVAPAAEIPPRGDTPVDPHHSDVVAVENPAWEPSNGWWGSETPTMYQIFARLSEGRRSVAVIANGGGVTLDEIDENIRATRPIVLVAGSGRAADAVVTLLNGTTSAEEEVAKLRGRAEAAQLHRRPDLFHIVELSRTSAPEFAELLAGLLQGGVNDR